MSPLLTLERNGLRLMATSRGDGPLVLCLHGFPDSPATFDGLGDALVDAGYRVVCPWSRGYTMISLSPQGDYDVATAAEDARAWIDHLGARRARVVGHDWGAITAYALGAAHPDRVHRMVAMVAPPLRRWLRLWRSPGVWHVLPRQLLRSWYFFALVAPGGVRRARRQDLAFVRHLWSLSSPGWTPGRERELAVEGLAAPGVLEGAIGYYRRFFRLFLGASRSRRLLCADVPPPTLMLAGERDRAVDVAAFEALAGADQFPGGMVLQRIQGAGHFPHLEKPDRVIPLVLDWLARDPS